MSGWATAAPAVALFAAGRLARAPLATAFTVLVIAIALTLPTALALAIISVRAATGDFANAVDVIGLLQAGRVAGQGAPARRQPARSAAASPA